MTKIAHLTSAHQRFDTRIFLKQARSLAAAGYQVSLIVADGLGDAEREGVSILDVGKPKGRLDRMTGVTRQVLRRAVELDAEIYHLHDPELLPAALSLKRRGKHVIFDAHEDLPQQIMAKTYLPPIVRRPISTSTAIFERFACRKLDAVVAATPVIKEKFAAFGIRAVDINNYPLEGELEASTSWHEKKSEVCYVGGISAARGIKEIVRAMELSNSPARLNLVGSFSEGRLKSEVEEYPGWTKINELGFLSRAEIRQVLDQSVAGLCTLLATPNHIESRPIKMFEYMSAGLPVIASNFPLWRDIVKGDDCGLCVDPLNPSAIAAAIDHFVNNPEIARRMGENGRRAIAEKYNWKAEEKKLLALYEEISAKG